VAASAADAAAHGGGASPTTAADDPRYVGRFAPSPTGPLHDGSLVAALASWLDARAHGGRWLVRIEDLDTPRNVAGAAESIVAQLERCGLVPDGPVVFQSQRTTLYENALQRLLVIGRAYPCGCSRRDLQRLATASVDDGEGRLDRIYPGTCRDGLGAKAARSVRLKVRSDASVDDTAIVSFVDRRLGARGHDVARDVGDFVLKRADGVWAYQLAVVVDDAVQGVSDIVRGEDLVDSTPRQILLQRVLGLPTPRYLHTPLVRAVDGSKLSKQTGAAALDLASPLDALRRAGAVLGVEGRGPSIAEWLASATARWAERLASA
jgi:glutamyl-Q tRNA(Asp) synthetase